MNVGAKKELKDKRREELKSLGAYLTKDSRIKPLKTRPYIKKGDRKNALDTSKR